MAIKRLYNFLNVISNNHKARANLKAATRLRTEALLRQNSMRRMERWNQHLGFPRNTSRRENDFAKGRNQQRQPAS